MNDTMTSDRMALEYIRATGVQWSVPATEKYLTQFHAYATALAEGKTLQLHLDMGSCQCGSLTALMTIEAGVPWLRSPGSWGWKRYDGPAAGCFIGYGMGGTARLIAALLTGERMDGGVYNANAAVKILA